MDADAVLLIPAHALLQFHINERNARIVRQKIGARTCAGEGGILTVETLQPWLAYA